MEDGFFSSSMCKCRIISWGKGFPRSYICSRDFHFKDLAISSFWYAWDSNMKTSMKNRLGGIIVCLMQHFEYIIMLSILFIIIENIFAMPFSPPVHQKPLVEMMRFLTEHKLFLFCKWCLEGRIGPIFWRYCKMRKKDPSFNGGTMCLRWRWWSCSPLLVGGFVMDSLSLDKSIMVVRNIDVGVCFLSLDGSDQWACNNGQLYVSIDTKVVILIYIFPY